MTHYIYPQNLKATANMWLWSLRDFAIMGVAALISIVILVELHLMLPAAATLCYGILCPQNIFILPMSRKNRREGQTLPICCGVREKH